MTQPRFVRLDELDSIGRIVELSDEQATVLAQTKLVDVQPTGAGTWRVFPNGRVGSVRVGDIQIDVSPKDRVGLTQLLFLLGYAADPGFRDEDVVGVEHGDLWPALGLSLTRLVDRALGQGVLQGYRTVEESLRTIRGRIRFEDQVRVRQGLLVPIEVTYDEFSIDIPENQILRAAVRTMAGVPGLDGTVRRRLVHLDARLEGVTVLPPGTTVPPWRPSRLNERYQPALRLAEVVLRHAATKSGQGGKLQMASFVVVMWKVFEDFVTTALREALRTVPGRTEAQLPAYLTGDGNWTVGEVPMNVDVAHLDLHGRPQVVFDAKYSVASADGSYASANFYQMLAYCTALQVPRAWLIYAGGSGRAAPRRVKNTGIEIVQYPLDLAQAPRDILAQVFQIAQVAISRDTDTSASAGQRASRLLELTKN